MYKFDLQGNIQKEPFTFDNRAYAKPRIPSHIDPFIKNCSELRILATSTRAVAFGPSMKRNKSEPRLPSQRPCVYITDTSLSSLRYVKDL